MPKGIKKCEHCGEEFEFKRSSKRYCSPKCRETKYYENNLDKIREREKANRLKYSEARKIYTARWRENNKERYLLTKQKWREANKEKVKTSIKKWHDANKEKVKATTLEWRKNNPERYRENERRYMYRKLGYSEEWIGVKELQYQIKQELKNQQKEGKENDI